MSIHVPTKGRMLMKAVTHITAAVAALALLGASEARAALKVVATTQDLGSIARDIGGDKIQVDALGQGSQDPPFVEPKPSFILKLHAANLLIVVGRELEIGWLPPLITQSRNAKIQPGSDAYLDASLTAKILEIPTGQITRSMGDVHPLGNPHYWLSASNRLRIPPPI